MPDKRITVVEGDVTHQQVAATVDDFVASDDTLEEARLVCFGRDSYEAHVSARDKLGD